MTWDTLICWFPSLWGCSIQPLREVSGKVSFVSRASGWERKSSLISWVCPVELLATWALVLLPLLWISWGAAQPLTEDEHLLVWTCYLTSTQVLLLALLTLWICYCLIHSWEMWAFLDEYSPSMTEGWLHLALKPLDSWQVKFGDFFIFIFWSFRAVPMAYGGSQP